MWPNCSTVAQIPPGVPTVRKSPTTCVTHGRDGESASRYQRRHRDQHRAPRRGAGDHAITLAELRFGVLVAKESKVRAERLRRLLVLQRTFDALPVDEAVAANYGQVAWAVVEAGRRPRSRSMDL